MSFFFYQNMQKLLILYKSAEASEIKLSLKKSQCLLNYSLLWIFLWSINKDDHFAKYWSKMQ
jgi:hypothetical protein